MPQSNSSLYITDDKNDLGETVVLVSDYCGSDSPIWLYFSFGMQTCVLVVGSVLAYQMRKVPNDVNDSKPLAFMIFSSFFFLTLRFVMFMVGEGIGEDYASVKSQFQKARSMFLSLDAINGVLIFFVRIFRKKKEKKRPVNQGASYFTNSILARESGDALTGFDDSFSNTDRPINTGAAHGYHRQSSAPTDFTRRRTELFNMNESSGMGIRPLRRSMPDRPMDFQFDSPGLDVGENKKRIRFADSGSSEIENDSISSAQNQDAGNLCKNSLFADDYTLQDENESPPPKCDVESPTENSKGICGQNKTIRLADEDSLQGEESGKSSIVRIRMKDDGKTYDVPLWILEEYSEKEWTPLVKGDDD